MRTILALVACLLLAPLVSCGQESARSDATGPLRIAASIPPLEWIAAGLAPKDAQVSTLLPPGASEHGYEPPPSRLAELVRADVVLLVGLGLDDSAARALRNAPKGGRAVIVFAETVDAADRGAHTEGDGHDHAHDHSAPAADPHLWLDPSLMVGMINATHDALARQLSRRNAEQTELDTLAARRDALLETVNQVDADYRARLAPYQGAAIVAAHDSMRRLADRYGLQIVGAVHAHEGSEATPGSIFNAAQALRNAEFRVVLIEPQSGRAVAERLSDETGAPIAEFDTLGSGDWEATMRANLDALVEAFATDMPASR